MDTLPCSIPQDRPLGLLNEAGELVVDDDIAELAGMALLYVLTGAAYEQSRLVVS